MQDVRDHLEALGRPARSVCFVEPKYASSGIDEQEDLARYYHDRYGLRVMHADPAELTLDRGEVRYGGEVVDVAYRDYSVADLQALREPVSMSPRCERCCARIVSSHRFRPSSTKRVAGRCSPIPFSVQSTSTPKNGKCFAGMCCGRESSPTAARRCQTVAKDLCSTTSQRP